jgi:predicted CXXCH cytochrome family protein
LRRAIGTGRPYRYEQQNATFEWRYRMMTSAANLDSDLSNDRPISMPYHENAGSHAIARGICHVGHPLCFDSILPFFNGQVECATCHDPLDTSHGNTTMLHQPLAGPTLCLHCHNK